MTHSLEDFRVFLLVDEALAEDTVASYTRRLRHMLKHGFCFQGFLSAPALARKAGREWLAGARARNLTPGGYNGHVKVLNALARYAGHDVRFKPLRNRPAQPRAISAADLARAFAFVGQTRQSTMRARALLQFAFTVGARPAEVAHLEQRDLDPARSTVHIRKPAKGGLRRTLPVPRELWDPTRPFAQWLRHRPIVSDDPGAIWTADQRGNGSGIARRMSKTQLTRIMDAVSRATGVRVNFVIARHTVATRFDAIPGVDVLYIKFYLGHAKVQSTMVYIDTPEAEMIRRFRELPVRALFPKTREETP